MKKSTFFSLLLSIFVVGIIILCIIIVTTNNETDDSGLFEVILVDLNGNEVEKRTISYEKDEKLLDILNRNFQIEYENSQYGPFITRIESLHSSSTSFICIYVNDEMSMVGLSSIEVFDNMRLKFVLTSIN